MRGVKRRNRGKEISVFELDVGAALADERNHGGLEEIHGDVEASGQKTDFHDAVELDLGNAASDQRVCVAEYKIEMERGVPIVYDLLIAQVHDSAVMTAQLLHRLFNVRNINVNRILCMTAYNRTYF